MCSTYISMELMKTEMAELFDRQSVKSHTHTSA